MVEDAAAAGYTDATLSEADDSSLANNNATESLFTATFRTPESTQ